jgi:lipopolysaccharide/colanic/teichoic acid biosynthesis glycosyltransferase
LREIVIIPRCGSDSRAEELLRLAVEMNWLPLRKGRWWTGPVEGASGSLPAEWQSCSSESFKRYSSEIELPESYRAGGNGGLLIRNGRYTVNPGGVLRRRWPSGADIVAVTVTRDQSEYRERLHATGDGKVVGFRRLYRDSAAPAPMPADWPHAVFIASRGLDALGSGTLPASFGQLVERARAAGLVTAALEIGGDVWDIGSDEGLLALYAATQTGRMRHEEGEKRDAAGGARLFGAVARGRRAAIAEGAVVIGPAFVADGASIGEQALVRASIVGPGAAIPVGGAVSNRVVLKGDAVGASRGSSLVARARPDGQGRNYRRWPLVSYPRLGKRIFDILFSLCAFVILATIFPMVAIAIKVSSRGPVLYGHKRQGVRGKVFRCLKFRTMVQGAEAAQEDLRAVNEVDGPQFKMEDDPRVTIVGAFLRATTLDEIPQIVTVLKGDMSIVGPRPSPDEENQMCPWWREARLSVRPGITGLWQVERSRARDNDFQEWIYYDVQYVRSLSFWRDVVIIVKTFGVLASAFANLFVTRTEAGTQR